MRSRPDDHVLLRYLHRDRLFGVAPVTVVRDDGELTALWLAAGTTMGRAVPVTGGRRMRDLPLDRLFSTPWRVELRPWEGRGILRLHPAGAAHSVWLFWGPEHRFRGWYVNLEQPFVRRDGGIDTSDWVLDLWVEPDGTWSWKDEHEVPVAVEAGFISAEDAARARAEGERVIGLVERGESPFSDGWERWRPDPAWPVPQLPAGWAAEP